MRALVNGSSVAFGPAVWDPSAFSAALGRLGVSASLPGAEPVSTLDFGGGVQILPVSDAPPSFDAATQQLVAGAPAIVGGVVVTSYTLASLPAATAAANLFARAIEAGLAVTSSGTPALNGTYAIDGQQQAHISAEITSILLNGTFTNGQTTRAWPDASGAMHTFTVAQFKALATAIGAYVDAVIMTYEAMRSGQAVPWPSAAAVIP